VKLRVRAPHVTVVGARYPRARLSLCDTAIRAYSQVVSPVQADWMFMQRNIFHLHGVGCRPRRVAARFRLTGRPVASTDHCCAGADGTWSGPVLSDGSASADASTTHAESMRFAKVYLATITSFVCSKHPSVEAHPQDLP